ncbi:MAG TPA: amino acid ABC transporter permease, partial [Agromyces sp.]|nr:amino acid ABC transporter permease [Agromyces sp.]
MSVPSVLFDAPGPKARRISLISSIVTGILILGGLTWIALTLAAPRESGGITLPGSFDPSRWDVFGDPELWWRIISVGVVGTLSAALMASVFAIALGVLLSLLRSSEIAWIRRPTA